MLPIGLGKASDLQQSDNYEWELLTNSCHRLTLPFKLDAEEVPLPEDENANYQSTKQEKLLIIENIPDKVLRRSRGLLYILLTGGKGLRTIMLENFDPHVNQIKHGWDTAPG